MPSSKESDRNFFYSFSLFILLIVVGGFGINALINFSELPPATPIFFIHGITMLVWYSLFVTQTRLIRSGNPALHMKLGKISIALALVMIISGVMMTLESFARTGEAAIVTVNLFILINFIILYSLALYRRCFPAQHKRLMLSASLALMLPAAARITQALGINDFFSLLIWLVLILVLPVYDFKSLRKVQRPTMLGVVLIILGMVFTIILVGTEAWVQFLESTIG